MTFAQLPGSPKVRDSYDITDSKTATPGVIEVGGGVLLCTVHWNGQYWIDIPANYPYVPVSPIQPNTGLLQYTVAQLPSYSQTVLSDTPGGYWRLGDASGNFVGSSGNGNTATATFTGTYNIAGSIIDDSNGAMTQTAATSRAVVAANASLPAGDIITVEFAFKRVTLSTAQIVIQGTGTGAIQIQFAAANIIQCTAAGVGTFLQTTSTYTDTNWHLFQMTKNGADSHIYIDGVEQVVTRNTFTLTPSTTALTLFCNSGLNGGFLGSLDEFAVYNSSLSTARLAAHYNQWIAKKNGSMAYATDGTPASNPVTGGSSGVTVTYTQGHWAAVL